MSTYTVQPGDTLWAIARRHDLSLQQLMTANPQIRDPSRIYVGEVISLFVP
jgi:peptidoglycan DL-endopeptidase LytE